MAEATVLERGFHPAPEAEAAAATAAFGAGRRVAMLLDNPATGDARVLREAEALAEIGFEVGIFCRREPGFAAEESVDGLAIRRFWPQAPVAPRLLVRWALAARHGGPLAHGLKLFVFTLLLLPAAVLRVSPPALRTRLSGRRDRPLFAPPPAPGTGRDRGLLAWLELALGKAYRNTFVFPALQQAVADWRPDVVHAHEIPMLPPAVDAARACGARVVYDAHELHQHTHPPRPPVLAFWFRLHEQRYARHVDAVITVSPSIAAWLQRDLELRDAPAVVMNAPRTDLPAPDGRRLRAELGAVFGEIVAAYVGRVRAGRGLEQLVEALPHAPQVRLAIVGPRDLAEDQRLVALAKRLGCRDRLHLLDPVPHAELVGYLREADCGVLPIQAVCKSYEFCLPNKLFETVFANVPVAVADLVELRRFVTAQKVGVVMDQRDPRDIARAIVEAAVHPYRRDAARCAGIAATFGWQAQSDVLRRLYAGLMPAARSDG